jgi:hypothetical protein
MINGAFSGSTPIDVTIRIVNLANNGGVNIAVTATDILKIGDLRGLFFQVSDTFIPLGLNTSISSPDVVLGTTQVSANNVIFWATEQT